MHEADKFYAPTDDETKNQTMAREFSQFVLAFAPQRSSEARRKNRTLHLARLPGLHPTRVLQHSRHPDWQKAWAWKEKRALLQGSHVGNKIPDTWHLSCADNLVLNFAAPVFATGASYHITLAAPKQLELDFDTDVALLPPVR